MEDVDSMLHKIDACIREHPEYVEMAITEFRTQVRGDYDVELSKTRRNEIFGRILRALNVDNIKIPRLREVGDIVSQRTGVPLPNSTRNRQNALVAWFDAHWPVFFPVLGNIDLNQNLSY